MNITEELIFCLILKTSQKFTSDKSNAVDDNIIKLAETDVECRKELHLLQVEVEKKKIRNLDLEFELIRTRLDYYKRRSFGT